MSDGPKLRVLTFPKRVVEDIPKENPNAADKYECIEMLKQWIKLVEDGEVVGVALAGITPDGLPTGEYYANDDSYHLLSMSVRVLDRRVFEDSFDEIDADPVSE